MIQTLPILFFVDSVPDNIVAAIVNRGCAVEIFLFHDRLVRPDTICSETGATHGPHSNYARRAHCRPHWLGNPVRFWGKETAEGTSEIYFMGGTSAYGMSTDERPNYRREPRMIDNAFEQRSNA